MAGQNKSSPIITLEAIMDRPEASGDERIFYGKDASQFGDLYLPGQPGPHPVVLLLHGGCWQAGYDLSLMGQMAAALKKEGLAVWNLEYRRLGNGGGWPGTFRDVAQGADHLNTLASQFNLDLSRVIAVGHSAGGHLALWLVGRHKLPANNLLKISTEGVRLRGIVSLAGIPDLIRGGEQNICGTACTDLAGGLPDEVPERYELTSPHAMLPLGVPHWHLVGGDDDRVPAGYIKSFVDLAASQDVVHLEIFPQAGHFEVISPSAAKIWTTIKKTIFILLDQT